MAFSMFNWSKHVQSVAAWEEGKRLGMIVKAYSAVGVRQYTPSKNTLEMVKPFPEF